MKYRLKILLLLLGVLFLAACSKKAVYVDESFSNDSPFKLRVDGTVDLACESARRSLLGQGYLIELANSDEVKGRKATRGENAFIEMNIVCVPESSGSTIFATGVLSKYDLKKNTSSASVGLSALGSISLPIGQSVDSLVKVSEETIDDKEFYKRFFAAVDSLLAGMGEVGKAPEESAVAPVMDAASPESAAPKTQSTIWPELFPEQDEPATAVQPSPEQLVPEAAPQPLPVYVEPGAAPESFPEQLRPATHSTSVPDQVLPGIPPAPAVEDQSLGILPVPGPDDEPLGIPPAPAPDDEPLGIPSVPSSQEEPVGLPPAPLSVQKSLGADESELAPISTTAVKRAAVLQSTPGSKPPGSPATRVEDLF